ncbi:unnamed protein product [Diamesa tonsa]
MDLFINRLILGLVIINLYLSVSETIDGNFVLDVLEKNEKKSAKIKLPKDDKVCHEQMDLLVESFNKRMLWALKVFDAWGKIQSGLFSGNLINFGHYDQCIGVSYKYDQGLFLGQHCMIFYKASPEDYVLKESSFPDLPEIMNVSFILGNGICLPATCSSKMVKVFADEMLSKNNLLTTDYDQRVFCNTNNILEMRNIDLLASLFFTFFLLVLIVSTVYDVTMRQMNQKQELIFSAFSIYTNGLKLLETQSSNDDIDCLYGIRALSIMWIIHGHRVQTYFYFPIINRVQLHEWLKTIPSTFSTSTTIGVNTFFLLSGFLVTKNILQRLDKTKKLLILPMFLHRYLRLTPVVVATIFCVLSLQRYFGDGPYQKFMVESYYDACEKYWWSSMLYIQNFVNPDKMCLPHSWYLSTDFQLFLMSPIIVYPLWKYGNRFFFFLPILALVSIGYIFITSMEMGIGVFSVHNIIVRRKLYNQYFYLPPYARMCAWLFGIMTAYILHNTKEFKIIIPKRLNALLWFLSMSAVISIILGMYSFQDDDHLQSQFMNSLYLAFGHLGWSMALSWIIFACHHGYGSFINHFLSLSVWKIISRFGLSIYLTHILAQMAIFGSQKQPAYFNEFLKTHFFFGDFVLSVGVALLAYLTFEAPVLNIEKYLFISKDESN